MNQGKDWTCRLWIYPALVILAGLPYVLSGSLHGRFVFDDEKLVRDNEAIRALAGIHRIFDIFSKDWENQPLRANYRPLRFLSYAIDYQVGRWFCGWYGLEFLPENPPVFIFHLTNLVLHVLNALLILSIGRRLLGSGTAALFLAAIFAVHPLQTEAVVYISGRRDVLSLFFFLAAIRIHLGGPAAQGQPMRARQAVLTALCFAAGLLSKEMVVTLPAVLLLIDWQRRAPLEPVRIASHAVLWILAAGFTWLQASNPSLVAPPAGGEAAGALLTAPRYIARYLGLALFPIRQSIDYSYDAIPVSTGLWSPGTTLPAIALSAALAVLGLWAWLRRRSLAGLGLLWFLGTLAPVLQIVPIPERFAERFAYLPGIGVFLVLAAAYARLDKAEPILARPIAALLILIASGAALDRAEVWRTPLSLWESAVESQPRCARAHIGLGNALREIGGSRLRDAAQAYARAIEILEENPAGLQREILRRGHLLQARLFFAEVSAQLGAENPERYRQAIADYRRLLQETDVDGARIADSEKFTVIYYQLGNCHLGLREWDAARDAYRKVLDRGQPPALVRNAHYFLGKIALAEGKFPAAIEELEAAYRMAKDEDLRSSSENGAAGWQNRYQLAGELIDALIAGKELARAGSRLDEALQLLRDRPERKHLLFRKARLLDAKGQIADAALALVECLEIDPEYGPALLYLASIEENRSNLDRSAELYQKVLQQDPRHEKALRGLDSIEIKRALARRSASTPEAEEALKVLDGRLARAEQDLEAGKLKAAEELYRQVADAPATPDSQVRRARALQGLGKIAARYRLFDKAEAFFQASLEADPGFLDAILSMADTRLKDIKDKDGARRYYRDYVGRIPAGKRGAAHAYHNLGLLVEDESPAEAADLYQKSIDAGEKDPAILRRLGYVLARLEKWEQALDALEKFLETAAEAEEKDRVRKYLNEKVLPHLSGEK